MLKLLCELLSEMVIYVDFYYRLGRVNGVGLGQLKISNVYNIITGFCSPGANATNLLYILIFFFKDAWFYMFCQGQ